MIYRGFEEKIIRLKPMVLGDMDQILVLYEAQIPGSSRGPQPGVDNFLLIKRDGKRRIVAVTNEIPSPERPLPPDQLHNRFSFIPSKTNRSPSFMTKATSRNTLPPALNEPDAGEKLRVLK